MNESRAAQYNRATYDRIWGQMSDFIRYNPGARHRRRHIFDLLAGVRFESLVDVGCGNGELLRLIDARFPGKQLAGVDLSPAVVAQNARALPHMRFSACNIENEAIPLVDGPVDVIVCSEVIEHLDHQEIALRAIAGALKPGGHAIITCPSGKVFATEKHFGHVRHPRPADLRRLAEQAGLRTKTLWNWGFPTYAFTKWATNIRPEAALAAFAGEKPYGVPQIVVSTALWVANFANARRSPFGVQLFALLEKPR